MDENNNYIHLYLQFNPYRDKLRIAMTCNLRRRNGVVKCIMCIQFVLGLAFGFSRHCSACTESTAGPSRALICNSAPIPGVKAAGK
jgi:hypothetical protein